MKNKCAVLFIAVLASGLGATNYAQGASANYATPTATMSTGQSLVHTENQSANTGSHNCTARRDGVLPDSECTPGATNPEITQDNIKSNICKHGWSTKSIRPSTSYTNPLKKKQIAEYGYKDTNLKHYEEDHLISLELGGNPTDPKNLWPESYNIALGAHQKDKVENWLHKQVCSGKMTLKEAQEGIAHDWTQYLSQVGKGKTK